MRLDVAIYATALGLLGSASLAVATRADDLSYAQIERGRYLAAVGDCVACHTKEGGEPFAGGRPIETPFGDIYSPNLTSDRATGIGAWTDDDFYRALHEGVRPTGERLYPAFPYTHFTKVTRRDVLAIRSYLNTLPAVDSPRKEPDVIWPLNYRVFMRGWNAVFFDEGTFEPDPQKSDEWNRGAYLVEGLGHCGACHTPKNFVGAENTDARLTGSQLQDWFAPKLADDLRDGLGAWNEDDIVEYLSTGRNRFSGAGGLMAEVVEYSTSQMTESDLRAIAIYLKDVPDGKEEEEVETPAQAQMDAGKAVFVDSCAACHQTDGKGVPRMFPPLAGNPNVQQKDPTTILRVILDGMQTVTTASRPTPSTMPAFDWKLTDAEIAAVATYVRNAWDNSAPVVTSDKVSSLRNSLRERRHAEAD